MKVNFSPEFAYVLGAVYGDGFVRIRRSKGRSGGEIGLKVRDKDFAEIFKKNLEIWSGREAKLYLKEGEFRVYLYSINHADFIKDLDIKEVLNRSKSFKHVFLRGLFDADGGIVGKNLDKRAKAKRWLHFSNNNLKLLSLVLDILKELDLKYSIKGRVHSGFGSKKRQYEIKIYNAEGILYYYQNIGFSIARKQRVLEKVVYSYDRLKGKVNKVPC